ILAGEFQHSAEQAKVRLAVLHLYQRRVVFPAQPQVESQAVGDVPIVLEVEAPDGGAVAPGSVLEAASVVGWQSQHKIGLAHQLAGGINGVGGGKTPGEVHVTAAAVVAGIENVHILAQNIATHFHHVAAANHGEVVRVVVRGGGEQWLGADVGVTQAGGIGEAVDGKQSGARVLHAQFAGNVSRPLIGA